MTQAPGHTIMTAAELLALPDDGCHQYELVRGRLIKMSPSSSKPAIVAGRVLRPLGNFVDEHKLGVFGGADWGFRLASNPDTVRSPDCAFVRAEHVPDTGVPDGFWPGAPDLVVEVLSPSNRFSEMLERVEDYLAAGTRLIWILDPEARTARVFHPDRAPAFFGEDGVLAGEDVLPGFTLRLADVWV